MAHFAQLDDNNTVLQVIVISNRDLLDDEGNEVEALGVAVCERVAGAGRWVQTSYNGNFRKRFSHIGFIYDDDADVFYDPVAPFPSWTLNPQHDWEAPEPKPEGDYAWNEETLSWEPFLAENPAP
jgi:hypothetical protein